MAVESTTRSSNSIEHPHAWVVAAEIVVDDLGGTHRQLPWLPPHEHCAASDCALDIYCRACRRPFTDVAKSDCAAGFDNRHLIGGDESVRAKRKALAPQPVGAKIVPGFTRYGLKAYVSGGPVRPCRTSTARRYSVGLASAAVSGVNPRRGPQ